MKKTIKNPSVQLFIFLGLFIAVYCGGIVAIVTATGGSKQTKVQQSKTEQPAEKKAEAITVPEKQATESVPVESEAVQTYNQPSQSQSVPVATENDVQTAHVLFTNAPVTAGDSESYVNTVGQCPFYEMAGEKGCMPPADIECNAYWSDCKLKDGSQ